MKITDKLRQAGEKGIEQVREGWQETRENLRDAQRRLRQRMRIFPRKKKEVVTPEAMTTAPAADNTASLDPSIARRMYKGIQLRPAKPFFPARNKKPGNEPAA